MMEQFFIWDDERKSDDEVNNCRSQLMHWSLDEEELANIFDEVDPHIGTKTSRGEELQSANLEYCMSQAPSGRKRRLHLSYKAYQPWRRRYH